MLSVGDTRVLLVEKPAAGGRMIARQDGQVVLVAGAIPGERVSVQVTRVGKGVAFAETLSVEHPSSDRCDPLTDPRCGGCLYAHIAYPRQLILKAEVISETLARIGRITLPASIRVAPSPVHGYRMRARLHFKNGSLGFFREGSYELCDARATAQLLPASFDVLDRLASGLRSLGTDTVREVEIAEDMKASHRAVHLHAASPVEAQSLAALARIDGLSGLSVSCPGGPPVVIGGDPYVSDTLGLGDRFVTLRRHVLAFSQGNRYLLGRLVEHVVGRIEVGSELVDLYAGTGVFSVSAAVARGARVTAVEGDRVAAADLLANASASGTPIEAVHQAVEIFRRRSRSRPDLLIVDPPRSGMSHKALQGAIALGAPTIVYVSCDVATLARDARRLLEAGYGIQQADAFDFFPNTPHVETVAVFAWERPA